MRKQTFKDLGKDLVPTQLHEGRSAKEPIQMQKQAKITVWKLTTPDYYWSMANQLYVGKQLVVLDVCNAIMKCVYLWLVGIKHVSSWHFQLDMFPSGGTDGHTCAHCLFLEQVSMITTRGTTLWFYNTWWTNIRSTNLLWHWGSWTKWECLHEMLTVQ